MSVLFIRVTKFIRSTATLNYYSVFIGALGNILYMLVLFSIHFMAWAKLCVMQRKKALPRIVAKSFPVNEAIMKFTFCCRRAWLVREIADKQFQAFNAGTSQAYSQKEKTWVIQSKCSLDNNETRGYNKIERKKING